jgi:hypothetical protein
MVNVNYITKGLMLATGVENENKLQKIMDIIN